VDAPGSSDILLFDRFRFDRRGRALFRCADDGKRQLVRIGGRALDVLGVLIGRDGDIVSKEEIMTAVWPGMVIEESNLGVQISALRRVLDQGRNGEGCIQTVTGRGYRFVLPVTRLDEPAPDRPSVPDAGLASLPASAPRSRHPLWHWLVVGSCAIAIALLLLAEAWHGGWFAGRSSAPRLSLVVLPFENTGGEAANDYLAVGITDDLTTALSHISGAFVIARATASTCRGKAEDIRKIGRDLNVRYVVRGSIQRFGEMVKVSAELGSTETGAQLWSDSFDQKIADLADGQEQIVIRMRGALNISFADIEAARSLRERPTNPDAFDLILRARAIAVLPQTKETAAQGLSLYEQALERDPNSVLALAGAVSWGTSVYYFGDNYGGATLSDAMGRWMQYLERAQKQQPDAETVLGAQSDMLDAQTDGLDYRRALSEEMAVGRRLIDLYPNNPVGYFRLGVVLRGEGRYDEAVGYFAKAIRLDPRRGNVKN
jgi:TolB-like protein/DNA-binding winged helix-turn-helix (wHTH) protein